MKKYYSEGIPTEVVRFADIINEMIDGGNDTGRYADDPCLKANKHESTRSGFNRPYKNTKHINQNER